MPDMRAACARAAARDALQAGVLAVFTAPASGRSKAGGRASRRALHALTLGDVGTDRVDPPLQPRLDRAQRYRAFPPERVAAQAGVRPPFVAGAAPGSPQHDRAVA